MRFAVLLFSLPLAAQEPRLDLKVDSSQLSLCTAYRWGQHAPIPRSAGCATTLHVSLSSFGAAIAKVSYQVVFSPDPFVYFDSSPKVPAGKSVACGSVPLKTCTISGGAFSSGEIAAHRIGAGDPFKPGNLGISLANCAAWTAAGKAVAIRCADGTGTRIIP